MKQGNAIKNEFQDLLGLHSMIGAFEEISAIRMRKVKKSVLLRREFLSGLNEAFSYIIYAYQAYRKSLKKGAKQEILNTNGRNLLVLLSSNTGLYGDIINRVFSVFAEEVRKSDTNTDVAITGKLGRHLYESAEIGKKYEFFEISDTASNDKNIKALLDFVTNYTNVTVYHGVFKSILNQEAQHTFLTGEVQEIVKNLGPSDVRFIFEPSVEKVAEYFEKQILSLIFEQSLFESSLSKYASRMVSLDEAAGNITSKLSGLAFDLKKAKHKETNRGLQQNLSGLTLWN